jgi:hypothetical protein
MELDVVILLSRSGWSLERLLRLTVNWMNGIGNSPETSGPTPLDAPVFEDFIRVAELMSSLQKRREMTMGYLKVEDESAIGLRFEPEFQQTPVVRRIGELLGIDPSQQFITLDSRSRLRRPDAICFELRSLVGILFFLSHGVQVPQQDISAGRITITRNGDGRPFDWSRLLGDLFMVHSQAEPPVNAAVTVNYRGY